MSKQTEKLTYASAGVDIDAGNRAVALMKESVRSTFRPGVLTDIGGFGGLFALDTSRYREPVLVSGTDGVGTKLRVAMMLNRHDTVGIDAVAMCANDILVQGAEPLFFLDYLAVGRLIPEKVAALVAGVAQGCRQAGCALIGGETAEMPGFYGEDEYDIAGFVVGVADRSRIIDGSRIKPGDKLIGLPSSGLHSNGFSLARKALFEVSGWDAGYFHPELGRTVGEEMLEPTRIYVLQILSLMKEFELRGMAHITGGGLTENVPRMLPEGLSVVINKGSWQVHKVFEIIRQIGDVDEEEMYRTFNMGIGFVMAVPPEQADGIVGRLGEAGEKAYHIGEVVPGDGKVRYL